MQKDRGPNKRRGPWAIFHFKELSSLSLVSSLLEMSVELKVFRAGVPLPLGSVGLGGLEQLNLIMVLMPEGPGTLISLHRGMLVRMNIQWGTNILQTVKVGRDQARART